MSGCLRVAGMLTIQSPMMRGSRQSKPGVFIGMCGKSARSSAYGNGVSTFRYMRLRHGASTIPVAMVGARAGSVVAHRMVQIRETRIVDERRRDVRNIDGTADVPLDARAELLEWKLEDAVAVVGPRQEIEQRPAAREDRILQRWVTVRVVAMRAVAEHVALRRELVVVSRCPRALGFLERQDVGGVRDARDHAVVDHPL